MSQSFLSRLPDYHFVDIDPANVKNFVFAVYEKLTGETLSPGRPERLFCEFMAYLLAHERVNLDQAARSQLLAYATGDMLEHIGARAYCERLRASAATTELHILLSTPAPSNWILPQGTLCTAGDNLYFATQRLLIIPAGEEEGSVPLACTTPGTVGNGYMPGQINRMVTPMPYVKEAVNLTESSGGADVESDDRYRERIHLAPAQWSTAGPDDAYRYWAMSAHQDIADVSIYSPAPVEVEIYCLLTGGRLPDENMLETIRAVFAQKERVPLTDRISVYAPEVVPFRTQCTWWLDREQKDRAGIIGAAVTAAVSEYELWQRSRIGRDMNPSELVRLVMQAGAKRVDVASPVFAVLQRPQLAVPDAEAVVSFGGVEDI